MPKKGDPSEEILELLRTKNRPYSVTNLVDEFHGAYTKTTLQKSIDDLVARGKVTLKLCGKTTKLYFQNQECLPVASKEEIAEYDSRLQQLSDTSSMLNEKLELLRQKRDRLASMKRIDDLRQYREDLCQQVQEAQKHKDDLMEAAQGLTPEDSVVIQKDFQRRCEQWFKRKAKCTEILDALGEGTGKKRSELIEELELESDEMQGLKLTKANRIFTIDEMDKSE